MTICLRPPPSRVFVVALWLACRCRISGSSSAPHRQYVFRLPIMLRIQEMEEM